MKLYYVDRAILRTLEPDGTYTATSLSSSEVYPRCKPLQINPHNYTYYHLGTYVLITSLDGENFIVGYYLNDYPEYESIGDSRKMFMEAEQLMMAGESRGFIVDDNGYIGVYYIERDPDGKIKRTPKFEYTGDDGLSIAFSSLLMSMTDGGCKVEITTDDQGLKHYSLALRGKNNDAAARYRKTIDSTPEGIKIKTIMDLSDGMLRTMPEPATDTLPRKLSIIHEPGTPLEIMLTLAGQTAASITVSPSGAMEIVNGIGAKAKVIMAADGTIELDAATGITIKGQGQILTDVLKEFLSGVFDAHTHATPAGPSAPPMMPSAAAQTKLGMIKGS